MLSELQQLADEGRLMEAVTPVDHMFNQYEARTVSEGEGAKLLANGNPISSEYIQLCPQDDLFVGNSTYLEPEEGQIFRMYDLEGKFQALYQFESKRKDGQYRAYKIFFQD